MKILAFFTNGGLPLTGLSPTIRIRDLADNSLVVTDLSMTEVGDGYYKYNFSAYDLDKDYSIRCDGGDTLPNSDRYTYAGNENYLDDIENSSLSTQITANQADLKKVLGLVHQNLYIDETLFDKERNLYSARLRIYENSASVGTASDVLATYEITAVTTGAGKFSSWKQVEV